MINFVPEYFKLYESTDAGSTSVFSVSSRFPYIALQHNIDHLEFNFFHQRHLQITKFEKKNREKKPHKNEIKHKNEKI